MRNFAKMIFPPRIPPRPTLPPLPAKFEEPLEQIPADEPLPENAPRRQSALGSAWQWEHRQRPDIRGVHRADQLLSSGLFAGHVLIRLLHETDLRFRTMLSTVGVDEAFKNEHVARVFWESELMQRLPYEPSEEGFVLMDSNHPSKPSHIAKLLLRLKPDTKWASATPPRHQKDSAWINLSPNFLSAHHTIHGAGIKDEKAVSAFILETCFHELTHIFCVGIEDFHETPAYSDDGQRYYCLPSEVAAYSTGLAAYHVHVGDGCDIAELRPRATRTQTCWYHYMRIFTDPIYARKHPDAAKAARCFSYLFRRYHHHFASKWDAAQRIAEQQAAVLW